MLAIAAFLGLGLFLARSVSAGFPFDTFDGPGHPACNEVSAVYRPSTIPEIVAIVKNASAQGIPVRASGNGHMWFDTMCSDDPRTIIIKTDAVNGISNLQLANGVGTVDVEAGVTFFQIADWLHARNASLGYTLVNWNITITGAIAMGAHRSSLKEDSQVSASATALDIINGKGDLIHLTRDQTNDTWLAATTSLGLLGVIAKATIEIRADFKVAADQTTLEEADVLNGDIFADISPYVTANYWWWPGQKKFLKRTYAVVPNNRSGNAFQSTFSLTDFEASAGLTLLNNGQNSSFNNFFSEGVFYLLWRTPNFHNKDNDIGLISWPVVGWAYDVLIGGLYPGQKTEWDYGMRGKTFEIAVPITQANALLQRIRRLFDESAADDKAMTSTYRSGINIKFGRPFDSLLGQVTQTGGTGADWSKGAIMFDFPSFVPTTGDHSRFNEDWYPRFAATLLNEFPDARPHWTKNTRAVLQQYAKNISPENVARFAVVRKQFDPQGTFKSIVGETIGIM